MTKSILESLFNGEIYPSEDIGADNQELRKLNSKIAEAKKVFLNNLSDRDQEIFQEVENLQNDYDNLYIYEAFTYGYRLGVRLLFEALKCTNDQNNGE
jgi:hypothetical protein